MLEDSYFWHMPATQSLHLTKGNRGLKLSLGQIAQVELSCSSLEHELSCPSNTIGCWWFWKASRYPLMMALGRPIQGL